MINEVLLAAAQYMDKHGKAFGRLRDERGRVCMLGAISMVADTGQLATIAESRLEDYAHTHGMVDDIPRLNDHILETKEETVKFMMEAAEWEPSK